MAEPHNRDDSHAWRSDQDRHTENPSEQSAATPNVVSLAELEIPHEDDSLGPPVQSVPVSPAPPLPDQSMQLLLDGLANETFRPATARSSERPTTTTDPSGDTLQTSHRGEMLGDYELLEEIARGSVGVVYKARQVSLGRIVAVKVIQAGHLATPEELRRFYAEAEAAASLHHPHVVPIYEIGSARGVHFFTMRYVEGGSLAEHKERLTGRWQETARLMATVAAAVHHAHRHGVLHRDLKPANILLDADGQPVISDFGLCKRLTKPSDSREGLLVGTPLYMAPEQVDGRFGSVSVASDVYSLGAILYELLTGQPPFPHESVEEVLYKLVNEDPPKSSQLRPGVPRDLEIICLKCLRKNPKERYHSAQELAEDLERFLQGEPIRARPVSWWERTWRWCRRHPGTAVLTLGSAAIGTAAVVVILIVAVLQAWREAETVQRLQHYNQEVLNAKEQAERERQRTQAVLVEVERQQRRTQLHAAALTCQQALLACMRGDRDLGLCWLARAMTLVPPGDAASEQRLRTLAACWQPWTHRLLYLGNLPERWQSVACHPTEPIVLGVSGDGRAHRWNWAGEAQPQAIGPTTMPVRDVRFLRAGQAILAITRQGWQVWDHQGHRLLDEWESDTPIRLWATAQDGQAWAIADQEGGVLLWAVPEGSQTSWSSRLVGRWRLPCPVDGLAIASQPLVVLARTSRGTWLLREPSGIRTEPADLATYPLLPAVSADGQIMGYATGEGLLRIYDVPKQRTSPILLACQPPIQAVRISADGRLVAGLAGDGLVRCLDSQAGTEIGQPLGRRYPVIAFDLTPDGRRLVTISEDGGLRVWEVCPRNDWQQTASLGSEIALAGFSATGKRLAAVQGNGLLVYERQEKPANEPAPVTRSLGTADAASPRLTWSVIGRYELETPATSLTWNREENRLLVTTKDGRLVILDVAGGLARRAAFEYGDRLTRVAWDDAGRFVAAAGSDRQIALWDIATKMPVGTRRALGGLPTALAFSPDGTKWAAGLDNGVICQGEPARSHQPPLSWPAHSGPVTALHFARGGRVLVSAGSDGQVLAWDTSKARLTATLPGHAAAVTLLVGKGPLNWFFSASRDGSGAIHDLDNGQARYLLQPTRQDWLAAQLSPDDKVIATLNSRPALELWCRETGYPLGPPLWLPALPRACQWLSPREVAVVVSDGRIVVWRIPEPAVGDLSTVATELQQRLGLRWVGETVRPLSASEWQQFRWQTEVSGGHPLGK